jgi:propanol-preferring alcohol dehydrogenase
MKAMRLSEVGPLIAGRITWDEVDVPIPGPGQAVIRVRACGVCRSNLHMIEGDWVAGGVPGRLPITPGHEVTGHVVAMGPPAELAAADSGVEPLAVGDPVGIQPLWWTCETCEYCLSGREELCPDRVITGEHVDGGYAEYVLANVAHAYRIPDSVDLEEAAPLFCPGITALGAVSKLDLGPGKRVAVFGVGGVGHMAIQFAALTGAEVFGVSRSRAHLDVVEALGARAIDASATDPIGALSQGPGLDAAIVFAPSKAVTAQAIAAIKSGGSVVIGVIADIDQFTFATGKTVIASILGNRAQMREVLRLAADGSVRAMVERFPMAAAPDVLGGLSAGEIRARAVLVNA